MLPRMLILQEVLAGRCRASGEAVLPSSEKIELALRA
jgi:hypothetical protein